MTTNMSAESEKENNPNEIIGENEWIIFQVNEGICKQACPFCYERPFTLSKFNEARNAGDLSIPDEHTLNNFSARELSELVQKHKQRLNFEMSLSEIKRCFRLLKEAGINRASLIGSQPSDHSNFKEILDVAQEINLPLRVYTADYMIDRLDHPIVNLIMLNIDHKRKKFEHEYMQKINNFIDQGKTIHLRVNFESFDMVEKKLIFDFYDQLTEENRKKVPLKYSFTVKVKGQKNLQYLTPKSLKENLRYLLNFIDEFKLKYPDTSMFTERPVIFRCAFSSQEQWDAYKDKGGFLTKCNTEFAIYSGGEMNFCPVARSLGDYKRVETVAQFKNRIAELRLKKKELGKIPSFEECNECQFAKGLYCQGGCLGYKT